MAKISALQAQNAGINFITNGDAALTTSIFTGYTSSIISRIPSGILNSGSAGLTVTRTTTAPLSGTASWLLSKAAGSTQGQAQAIPFKVDAAYRAKAVQISFDYIINSGTFSAATNTTDSDIIVYVYDVTNATFIEPSNIKLLSNNSLIADKFNATFQTSATGLDYLLVFHSATTTTDSFEIKIDGISVAPSTYVYGTPETDWQSYIPTFQGYGTPTNIEFQHRRVGANIEVRGKFTAGTPTAVEARISLPFTINPAVVTSISPVGYAVYSPVGTVADVIGSTFATLAEPNVNYLTLSGRFSGSGGLTKLTGTQVTVAGATTSFVATIPISGFSSSVQTSDQTDTRVVAARFGAATANLSITANTAIAFPLTTYDTHGAYLVSTYTIPVSGYYQFTANDYVTTATSQLNVFKNGVFQSSIVFYQLNGAVGYGNYSDFYNAGDLVTFRPSISTTLVYLAGTAGYQFKIGIERISGPSAIAATETVAASYYASTTQSTSTTVPTNFDTKEYDSHNAVTPGASWKFTAPVSGLYLVTSAFYVNNAAAGSVLIYKNGVAYKIIGYSNGNTIPGASTGHIRLNAGDFIDLRLNASGTVGGGLLSGATTANVSITKVGL